MAFTTLSPQLYPIQTAQVKEKKQLVDSASHIERYCALKMYTFALRSNLTKEMPKVQGKRPHCGHSQPCILQILEISKILAKHGTIGAAKIILILLYNVLKYRTLFLLYVIFVIWRLAIVLVTQSSLRIFFSPSLVLCGARNQ